MILYSSPILNTDESNSTTHHWMTGLEYFAEEYPTLPFGKRFPDWIQCAWMPYISTFNTLHIHTEMQNRQ